MSLHNYSDYSYQKSPLHTSITQLIRSLDVLKKKIKNLEIIATETESKYLEQFHQLWSSLHNDLLPIYSNGGAPSLSNYMAASRFDDEVDAFKPKKSIETPLDYELAKQLQEFMAPLLQQDLIKIAPFLNMDNIDITIWGYDVGKKIRKQMKKLNMDSLLLADQFQTNFAEKYNTLNTAIEAYRAQNHQTSPEISPISSENESSPSTPPSPDYQDAAKNVIFSPVVHSIKKAIPPKKAVSPKIKGLSPILDRLLNMSRVITKVGRIEGDDQLIQLSKTLRRQIKKFRDHYQNKSIKSKLTLEDCSRFKAEMEQVIDQIDLKMATLTNPEAKSLWEKLSLNFRSIVNVFVNLIQYVISPVVDISTNRNSMFTTIDTKIIEDLRHAVSEIPKAELT